MQRKKRLSIVFSAIVGFPSFIAASILLFGNLVNYRPDDNKIVPGLIALALLVVFAVALIFFIKGLRIRLIRRTKGEYENGCLKIPFKVRNDRSFEDFIKIYDDAFNQGYNVFVGASEGRLIFSSEFSERELFDHLQLLEKYVNRKIPRSSMPSFYKDEPRLTYKRSVAFIGTETNVEPSYETVNDYDDVTHVNGVEVDRDHHYTTVQTGWKESIVSRYQITATLHYADSGKPLLCKDGSHFYLFYYKEAASEEQ